MPEIVSQTENIGRQMQQKGAMSVLMSMSNDYPELKAMLATPSGEGGPGGAPAPPAAPAK